MKYEFTTIEQAEQITEPKHIWIDGNIVYVFTGEDMPEVVKPVIELDPAQFRKALLKEELLEIVEQALQDPSKKKLQIDYMYKPSFHSDDQRIIAMALELGKTEEWLYNEIFVYGQSLN